MINSKQEAFRQMLEVEFEEMERYIRISLAAIKTSEVQTDQKYPDPKAGNTEGFPFYFFGTVPFMLRHSLFISVYSFMEYSLKVFCETTAAQMNQYERRVSNFEKVHQYYSFLMNEV